jgi:hypothetical protein
LIEALEARQLFSVASVAEPEAGLVVNSGDRPGVQPTVVFTTNDLGTDNVQKKQVSNAR